MSGNAERAAVVKWLRWSSRFRAGLAERLTGPAEQFNDGMAQAYANAADKIERGAHISKSPTPTDPA